MATLRPMRGFQPDLPDAQESDSSIDQALTLLLADETEAALRWGAAAVGRDPSTPSALIVTARSLEQMGRTRAAVEGLRLAVQRALDGGNLPLAIAAIDELRAMGVDVAEAIEKVAAVFCESSPWLKQTSVPLLPHFDDFQPLSAFLAGPALASKATQVLQAAARAGVEMDGAEQPLVAPLPLFSALSREALRDLLSVFEVITVPAGHRVIEEGERGETAYIVARGELEVSRRPVDGKPAVVLARLGSGAFFGEMALLSDMPRAASVVATRPSILLVARRAALDAVSDKHPAVAVELAAHCRRRLVANLGRTAPMLAAVAPRERSMLVERFVTRVFQKGDRLVTEGDDVEGLYLVASGAVAIVAHETGERVVLATLGAGETIGEVELVLCRRANADAIAVQPTATLFLSREDFAALVQDHPAIVHGLYVTAVRRDAETSQALDAPTAAANDYQLDEKMVHELSRGVETRPEGRERDVVEARVLPRADPLDGLRPVPPVASPPIALPARTATLMGGAAAQVAPLGPPILPAVRAPASAPGKRAVTAPISTMPPTTASARPAPRQRLWWELPPVVVASAVAVAAAVVVALITPSFGRRTDTAAAGGGGGRGAMPSAEAPVTTVTATASETFVEVPVAPPPAPVKTATPAAKPRAPVAVRAENSEEAAPEAPTASATATPAAAPAKPTSPAAQSGADDFGGRE